MKRNSGFSLVEVVLALGIIAFAITATLGLLSVGLDSNKLASEDSALGFITQTISSNLAMQGFATSSSKTQNPFFFSWDGTLDVDPASGLPVATLQGDSIFTCVVTPKALPVPPSANLLIVQLDISWPCRAPVARRQHRIVLVSLANRDNP